MRCQAVSAVLAVMGMCLSYLIDVASGATVVLVAAALFLATLAYNHFRRRESLAVLGSSRAAMVNKKPSAEKGDDFPD